MPPSFVAISLGLLIAQIEGDEGSPWYGKFFKGILLLLLAWFFYHAWRNKNDFEITVFRGEVAFRGKLPQISRSTISQFLLCDLAPAGKVRVIGNWTSRRVLRISVRGDVSSGDCQRIRNFMKLTLKG